jgi:hypothetical protein
MQKIKQFFGIITPYQFERMDISTFFTFLNTCIIVCGKCAAPMMIAVNVVGLVWDLREHCHLNCVFMRLSLIVMNIYFLVG